MTLDTAPTREWVKPTFDHPYVFNLSKMILLGVDRRGRQWWTDTGHPQWGELVERGTFDESRQVLPDLPLSEMSEAPGIYIAFDVFHPGTFAALTNTIERKPTPPAPVRPIDRLGFVFLADRIPEKIFAAAPPGVHPTHSDPNPLSRAAVAPRITEAEPQARGAAILDRLQMSGADVCLATDGEHLIVSVKGGVPGPGVVELVETAGPLIVAYLQGSPLTCRVSAHAGKDGAPEATTLTLGDTPWCGQCVP